MSYFIVVEGIDGAGTTSQSKRLVENLKSIGKKATFTFEPSDGEIGKFIRSLFTRDEPMPSWEAMSLLFSADRIHHIDKVITPALDYNTIVVSDRYYYSTLGYQTYLAGLFNPIWQEDTRTLMREKAHNWIMTLNRYAMVPDLTIVIDVPMEVAQARLGRKPDQFESKADLQKYLADYYCNLNSSKINQETILHVDGTKSKDEVEQDIWYNVRTFLKLKE